MAAHEVKNILFIAERMQARGISKYGLHLARELSRRGYWVSVICGPGPLVQQFRRAHINIAVYPEIGRRLWAPFLMGKLLAEAREFQPDIFHLQSSDVISIGTRLASALRKPLVVTAHRLMLRGWRMWQVGRRAARVIAVSEAVREDLVNIGRVPKQKIEVIPNGLDVNDYPVSPPSRNGAPVVGMMGGLEKVKGGEYFLAAAKRILDQFRDTQFLIAGGGSEEKNLRRQVRALGITKNVTFAIDVTDHRAVLRTIDILVLPSLREGLGFGILEAMAMGKPVVASAVGGVYSLVLDGQTGFLVDKGDSKAIAEKVSQLIRDRDLAVRMGTQARERVEKQFDIWSVANRTIEVYKQVAQPGPG